MANARLIPIAREIFARFTDLPAQQEIGRHKRLRHHHEGNIGILDVDRHGDELYQITLGGEAEGDAALGDIIGPSFPAAEVAGVIETIVRTYAATRLPGETFLVAYHRRSAAPFKEALCAGA